MFDHLQFWTDPYVLAMLIAVAFVLAVCFEPWVRVKFIREDHARDRHIVGSLREPLAWGADSVIWSTAATPTVVPSGVLMIGEDAIARSLRAKVEGRTKAEMPCGCIATRRESGAVFMTRCPDHDIGARTKRVRERTIPLGQYDAIERGKALRKDLETYRGRWVALDSTFLIVAIADNPVYALSRAKDHGVAAPTLLFVPAEGRIQLAVLYE